MHWVLTRDDINWSVISTLRNKMYTKSDFMCE